MGLFLLYVFSPFAEALQVSEVHGNPRINVVYIAFCIQKINPWKLSFNYFITKMHIHISYKD